MTARTPRTDVIERAVEIVNEALVSDRAFQADTVVADLAAAGLLAVPAREPSVWVCARCGDSPEAHASADSKCIYEPMLATAATTTEWGVVRWDLEEEKRMSTDDTELTYVDGYNAGYAAGLRSGRKKGEQAAAEATRELHRVQEVARAQRAALDAVLEMHFKSVDGWCAFDDEQYPCSTIHEIESHLRRGGVA